MHSILKRPGRPRVRFVLCAPQGTRDGNPAMLDLDAMSVNSFDPIPVEFVRYGQKFPLPDIGLGSKQFNILLATSLAITAGREKNPGLLGRGGP